MRLIIFITALLAILWSSFWLIMSKNYLNQLNAWINTDQASMTAKVNEIRGFPNRFDTTIADLEIKQSIFGPLRIDRLDVMRLSYDDSHYIFAANKIQNFFDIIFEPSRARAKYFRAISSPSQNRAGKFSSRAELEPANFRAGSSQNRAWLGSLTSLLKCPFFVP